MLDGSAASMAAAAAGADGAASVAPGAGAAGTRSAWWRARAALDGRLRALLRRLDADWLGPWRCARAPDRVRAQQLVRAHGASARARRADRGAACDRCLLLGPVADPTAARALDAAAAAEARADDGTSSLGHQDPDGPLPELWRVVAAGAGALSDAELARATAELLRLGGAPAAPQRAAAAAARLRCAPPGLRASSPAAAGRAQRAAAGARVSQACRAVHRGGWSVHPSLGSERATRAHRRDGRAQVCVVGGGARGPLRVPARAPARHQQRAAHARRL